MEGAFIVLLDPDDRVVDTDMTTEDGSFHLSASGPGVYRLRSERLGYASSSSNPFDVPAGGSKGIELLAAVQAVSLEPIAVAVRREESSSDECRTRPQEVENLAVAWEEARKALTRTAWTTETVLFEMKLYLYERFYETKSGRLVHQNARNRTGVNRASPFVSMGVDHFKSRGFASFGERAAEYHGPDPEVLVSDWFLETHCFWFTAGEGERSELLGLAFRPVHDPPHPEIEGILWLDPRESALHSMDFSYLNVPAWVGGYAKGHLEFRHLPSGEWIVDRWWIRAPDFVPEDNRSGKWTDFYGVPADRPGAITKMVGGELMRAEPVRRVSPTTEGQR